MKVVGVSLCVRKTRIKSMNLISVNRRNTRPSGARYGHWTTKILLGKVGEIKRRKRQIALPGEEMENGRLF